MFSPVKSIVAGALFFALGGVLLIAQPFDQQAGVTPGAQLTEPPVAVSVDQDCDISVEPIVCGWTASDPRLEGTMTHTWARPQITARLVDDDMGIGWAPATLEGAEGNWTGHLYAVWADPAQLFVVLSGDGAYEGWQYLASTIDSADPGDSQWVGVMYQGELPPFGALSAPADG